MSHFGSLGSNEGYEELGSIEGYEELGSNEGYEEVLGKDDGIFVGIDEGVNDGIWLGASV